MGGLQGILLSGTALLISILNYNYLESYLVSKLFKYDSVALEISQAQNIKEYCRGLLPCKITCSAKSRKQLALENARASLEKQVDIINMIKSRRYVHLALKHLIDPALRKELKTRSQFHDVDIEKPDS